MEEEEEEGGDESRKRKKHEKNDQGRREKEEGRGEKAWGIGREVRKRRGTEVLNKKSQETKRAKKNVGQKEKMKSVDTRKLKCEERQM